MASARRPPDPNADRTLDYGTPRRRPSAGEASVTLPAKPESAEPTRKGVGHDARRPPPAALPKRARRLEHGFGVGLAIPDALFRASLARALVRSGFDVHNVLSPEDVAVLARKFRVAIVDFDSPDAPGLFAALQETNAAIPILALATQHEKIRRALRTLPLCPHEVVERTAPIADLTEALARLRHIDD